jgi:hypothetical protein
VKSRLSSCAGRYVAVVAVAFVASSCFDAHQVDPGSLDIDNFDNGPFPTDSTFQPWQCLSFDQDSYEDLHCAYDQATNDGSKDALSLEFKVTDQPNYRPDQGGVSLVTRAARGLYRDFTAFTTLSFEARVESSSVLYPGTAQLPGDAQLFVRLGCSTTQPGAVVLQEAENSPDPDWRPINLRLANFAPPPKATLVDGLAGCLGGIDEIDFIVEANLIDGKSAAGTLKIDHVYLK